MSEKSNYKNQTEKYINEAYPSVSEEDRERLFNYIMNVKADAIGKIKKAEKVFANYQEQERLIIAKYIEKEENMIEDFVNDILFNDDIQATRESLYSADCVNRDYNAGYMKGVNDAIRILRGKKKTKQKPPYFGGV